MTPRAVAPKTMSNIVLRDVYKDGIKLELQWFLDQEMECFVLVVPERFKFDQLENLLSSIAFNYCPPCDEFTNEFSEYPECH